MRPPLHVLIGLLICPMTATAQVIVQRERTDVPVVTRLLPAALARGQTVEVTLTGERLEGIDQIQGAPGLRLAQVIAVEQKQARVLIEVPADASPGFYACCFLAKAGLSNPKILRVDAWPQVIEQEDNNQPSEATRVSPPVGINGVLTAADCDYFRFEVEAGQRLVFDVEAQRLGSPLRPMLTLFDAADRELHSHMAPSRDIAPDNRLAYTFRSSGTYLLRLRDLTFAGADYGVYHVRIGPIVYASSMFPLGGQRGGKVAVTFAGGTLAQPLVYEVDLTGDVPWRRTRLSPRVGDDLLQSPAWFAAGDLPEVFEQEENNEAGQAQSVVWPAIVNGQIMQPGDRDHFRISATAGAKLSLKVAAQGSGSPLDAVLSVYDASGKELLSVDDPPPTPREAPLVRSLAAPLADDPVAEFVAPAQGDYLVSIEDRFGFGGPQYAYRLEISAGTPDFDLVVQPGVATATRDGQPQQAGGQVRRDFSGAGTGSLSIDRGGTASLVVRAFRGGYQGPVQLSVEGLPGDVHAAATTIAAGQNEATIRLTADFEAASATGELRVTGTGQVDSTPPAAPTFIKRIAVQPVVLAALGNNGAVEREFTTLAWGVSRQGAELALQASLNDALVVGGTSTLRVIAKRREGLSGDIALQLISLPAGLTATAVSISAPQSQIEIPLAAGSDLAPGRHSLLVEGRLAVAGRPEPIVAAFPLGFEALPVAVVELSAQQLDVPQGDSARLHLQISRHGSSAEPIELSLVNLPKGVTAAGTTIAGDAKEFDLVLSGGDAKPSPIRRIVQIKLKTQLDGRTIDLPALRFALRVTSKAG
ncbi:MAG TPA: PPC domain-containing protein [Pirellulales bacterium]|nr:PPC domain-containing protein [Pirellulales bacterium]